MAETSGAICGLWDDRLLRDVSTKSVEGIENNIRSQKLRQSDMNLISLKDR